MAPIRSAEIVAVGTELLTPFRADTNSLWLTARLNEIGIEVRRKTVAGDDVEDLAAIVSEARERSDLLVTTGGLGPTADDVTRDAVARALGRELVLDEEALAAIRERFERRGMRMPEVNRRQALMPAGAVALPNAVGSAPGLWIESGDRACVLLPGPPRELQPMYDAHVARRLRDRAGERHVRRRVIALTGQPESKVDEIAQPIYAGFAGEPVPIATTILASPGRIELHLWASGTDAGALDRALQSGVSRLLPALGRAVYSTDGRSLEEVVADRLLSRGLWLAVAESCTGGRVLGRLTDVPGSSAWLRGGVVAYDNAVKIDVLGVAPDLLRAHGAVSEPVAAAMARGVRERLRADVAIAVTGIAGPTGGTPDKPVGTVVIAVDGIAASARTFRFAGDRSMVRQFSVAASLDLVRRVLD
jgi:nicotinamide-nucleotide amidase